MSDKEDNAKLVTAVNQLDARIKELEAEKKAATTVADSTRERLNRERQERQTKTDTNRTATGDAPLINPRRAEEAQRRYAQLYPPQTSPKRTHSPAPQAVTPVKFYCWKEGKAGKITFAVLADFSEDS